MAATRALALAGCALLAACSVTRVRVGSPLRADPRAELTEGVTTRAQVLERFGPPDGIARHARGEVFSYRHTERVFRSFELRDPIATGFSLLRYDTVADERSERLLVLFDAQGVVSEFGYRPGAASEPGPEAVTPTAICASEAR